MTRMSFQDLFRRSQRASRRATAFSLAEMLVALAVLIVALAVVTQIFGVTTKTAQTSTALSEAQAWLEPFLLNLEKDLDGIDPAKSILAISGRTQAAGLTEDQRVAGRYYRFLTGDVQRVAAGYNPETSTTVDPQYSDPRADLLMFYSNRGMTSRSPATTSNYNTSGPGLTPEQQFQRALQTGSLVAPMQVMYGHVALTDVSMNGTVSTWPANADLKHIERRLDGDRARISDLPAVEWVLGRRATAIFDTSQDMLGVGILPNARRLVLVGDAEGSDYDNDEWIRIMRCYNGSGENGAASRFAGDSARYPLSAMLAYFSGLPFGTAGNQGPRLSPYDFTNNASLVIPGRRWTNLDRTVLFNTMFPRAAAALGEAPRFRHFATLARNAPKQLESNQSLKALPGCVWFQVEFLMPEDPRNSVFHPITGQRNDMPRWCRVPDGQTYVFVPDSTDNRDMIAAEVTTNPASPATNGQPLAGSRLATFAQVIPPTAAAVGTPTALNGLDNAANRRVRMWPYAIRITVRAHDPKGRLNDPIVRTLVHRFED